MSDFSNGYFSRRYLQATPEKRLKKFCNRVEEAVGTLRLTTDIAKYIKLQVGIGSLIVDAWEPYVDWHRVFHQLEFHETLDVITACVRFLKKKSYQTEAEAFTVFVERAFREEGLDYRIDQEGEIHPFIDVAFTSDLDHTLTQLVDVKLSSAASSLARAEKALLSHSFDGTTAVREAFSAAEHIFKRATPNATALNVTLFKKHAEQELLDIISSDSHSRRAAGKLISNFNGWIDAAHFYRHDPGKEEHIVSREFAILFVSQSFGYCRLLAELPFDGKTPPSTQ